MTPLQASLFALILFAVPAQADIVWTGAVSNDIFDENNWDLSGSTVTVVDPNVTIDDNVVIANAASPVEFPNVAGQVRFQIGRGRVMTLDNSTLIVLSNDGIGGAPTTSNGPTVRMINGSQLVTYFIVNGTHLEITQGCTATFGGPATPINGSTVDLLPNSVLTFTNETVQEYINEHLSKTTVSGAPAVVGVNITVVSDGAAGSIIEVISSVGTNYCFPSIANSSGASAAISASGTSAVISNNLSLTVSGMPANQLGYFLCGQFQSYIPGAGGSQGALCLVGRMGRFVSQIQNSGPAGEFSIQVDLGALPVWRPHAVLVGETWNFQAWFVDGSSSNFSDGISITFQ